MVHLAAFVYVGESMLNPGAYYRNNIAAFVTLLEVMRDHGVGPLVFLSSCATYRHPRAVPIEESHP